MVDTDRSRLPSRTTDSVGRRAAPLTRRTVFSLSPEETLDLGRSIGRSLRGGELILLEGDLGLGKTVLAKGIAAGLGIGPDEVTSPSFTLVQEYVGGRLPMFHVDLYRLDELEELGTIGIEEILGAGGLVVVEWGEKLPPYLRQHAVTLRLRDVGEGSRRIEVLPAGQGPAQPHSDA